MREFYQEKLREMETLLAEKEQETEKLVEELSKLDKDHSGTHELAARLKKKQEQVAELKRKQSELTRLTTVASKNESQISKLSSEVYEMKYKKVELQKQMAAERKSHALEVQKLKKESMQQQKELNKVKQLKDKKTLEAERAQQMAKTRLEQVFQLKNKYKESEKRLRILTVKRGVMSRAGLDPVMVGRRQSKNSQSKTSQSASDQQNEESINLDGLREFFDQKVADVGRREALAEKLAQEWEEHLDLSSQREDLQQNDDLEDVEESIESLDSQIKYKEGRIRQLAARLGKPKKGSENDSTDEEMFLFTKDFKKHVGSTSKNLSLEFHGSYSHLPFLPSFLHRCVTNVIDKVGRKGFVWYGCSRAKKDCCACANCVSLRRKGPRS
jgi:myosin heavy subunit